MATLHHGTRLNVVKICRALKGETSPLTVGEIARRTGLHKWVVSRTLDVWMAPFVEVTVVEELEALGLRMKLVRLKASVTEQQVIGGLEAMKRV